MTGSLAGCYWKSSLLNNAEHGKVHPAKQFLGDGVPRKGREPDMATVGGRIAAARATKGLTQEKLAERIGVTKSAISQWERGGIEKLTAANMLKLAKTLEASAEWLWYGKDEHGQDIPMGMPQHLDPDASALVETFKLLEPAFRDALLGDANKYLRISASQQKPSRANPYPKPVKQKK